MKLQHEADKPASGNTGAPRTVSNPSSSDWHEEGPACEPLIRHYHHKASARITWDVREAAAAPLEPPRPDLLRRWLNVYEAPDAQAEAALAHETVMVLNQVGGGVRADTGVDRSLPLTAGRGRTTSGPPAAPLEPPRPECPSCDDSWAAHVAGMHDEDSSEWPGYAGPIRRARELGASGGTAQPLDVEAVNMLRRIVAAREMAWLDDEIEGAAHWLARLGAASERPEATSE